MGLLTNCPKGAAIPDVPIVDCLDNIGQVQKIIFQRIRKADGTKNTFVTATASPDLKASWTGLLAAADGTKVVQTPFVSEPEFEAGAARKYGGGNATLGGIEIVHGREPTTFTAMLLMQKQETIKALKEFMGENVGVYFIDEHGRIIMNSDGKSTVANYYPIPIGGLFIGDKMIGGLEAIDKNMIEFSIFPNWSDNLAAITPTDFDALNDLETPSLSNPQVNESIDTNDSAEIGSTSAISSTLSKDLPKSNIIRELDDNTHKYAKEKETKENKLLIEQNKSREILRRDWYSKQLKKWRRKTWVEFFIFALIFIAGILYIFFESNWNLTQAIDYFKELKANIIFSSLVSLVLFIWNYFTIKTLYAKYRSHSNIENFKKGLKIPENMKELKKPTR